MACGFPACNSTTQTYKNMRADSLLAFVRVSVRNFNFRKSNFLRLCVVDTARPDVGCSTHGLLSSIHYRVGPWPVRRTVPTESAVTAPVQVSWKTNVSSGTQLLTSWSGLDKNFPTRVCARLQLNVAIMQPKYMCIRLLVFAVCGSKPGGGWFNIPKSSRRPTPQDFGCITLRVIQGN